MAGMGRALYIGGVYYKNVSIAEREFSVGKDVIGSTLRKLQKEGRELSFRGAPVSFVEEPKHIPSPLGYEKLLQVSLGYNWRAMLRGTPKHERYGHCLMRYPVVHSLGRAPS